LVVIVVLCCSLWAQAQNLERVLFNADEVKQWGARCLNGSPSGFYYRAATSTASKFKWFIFLQGGGLCLINPDPSWQNVENCRSRVNTALGNSALWPATRGATNSYFVSDWNQVFIPYCGGDLHAGTIMESSSGLYYAGHNTIAAVLNRLNSLSFESAAEVLLSGESAGGIGVFTNANFVGLHVPKTAVLRAFPNAGWFLHDPPYNTNYFSNSFQFLYNNSKAYLDPACTKSRPNAPWDCFAGNYTFPFLTMPTFVANSIFDSNQLVVQAGIPNPGNTWPNPAANEYAVEKAQLLNNTLKQVANNPTSGIFVTTAFTHVLPMTETVQGHTLLQTLNAWHTGTGIPKVMDACKTPSCKNITLPTN